MKDTFTEPAPHPFTVEEFHRMGEGGVFGEDDRLEFLDGQILDVSPIGTRHASTVDRMNHLLNAVARGRAIVRVQNPIILDERSEPQPDLSLLRPRPDCYAEAHPRPADVFLVVEVADATLAFDRRVKLPLYARAGVAEVWLIDLVAGGIEVHRDPGAGGYGNVAHASRGGSVSVRALPEIALEVAEILG